MMEVIIYNNSNTNNFRHTMRTYRPLICVWIKELEYNGRKNTSQDFSMIAVVVAEERMYRSRLVKVHVFIEQRLNGFILM